MIYIGTTLTNENDHNVLVNSFDSIPDKPEFFKYVRVLV